MTKQKTAKLDLNGQKVDVGIPSHLLSDLGGTIYSGALDCWPAVTWIMPWD